MTEPINLAELRADANRRAASRHPLCCVLEPDTLLALLDAVETAREFAQRVLDCDTYGCEHGPGKCLHGKASAQLEAYARFQ
jgi:hypothetical protein